MYIYIIVFVLIIIIGIFLIFKFSKKRKISDKNINLFNKYLKNILTSKSYKEQIIDIDKLYHKILLEAGYKGTFGEILKKQPSEILNIQNIWDLHKLRNKLVHDFDILSERVLKTKSLLYLKEIKTLLKNLK